MSARISEGRAITLNAQGAGVASIGPGTSSQAWRLTKLTTFGASAVVPTLSVRRNSPTGVVVDSTRFGNSDVSETTLDVLPGESLAIVYAGGSPGAVMSFYAEGEMI